LHGQSEKEKQRAMATQDQTRPQSVLRADNFAIEPLSLSREILFIIVMCSAQGTVLGSLAQGILPGRLISKTFGASGDDIVWFPAAYGLTTGTLSISYASHLHHLLTIEGTFMLIAGRLGDIWSHKKLFLFGWLWSGLWALLAGISIYSRSVIFFDICRALQGIGSAIMVPIPLAIIGSVYKEGHRKNLAFSISAAGAPLGFTLGAVFSALFAQRAKWPWAYYATTIVCCCMASIAALVVPNTRAGPFQPSDESDEKPRFDWLGAFTGVAALVLFNVAWNRAPTVGWQSAQAIAPLTTGLALFMVFFAIEVHSKHPLLPIDKISSDAAWILFVTGLGWSSFGIHIYYLINFLSEVNNESVLGVASKFVPVPISGGAAAILTSFLLRKGMKTTWVLTIALVWFCVGNILLATTPVNQTYWKQVFWAVTISPLGIDMSFPAATIMISGLVAKEHQGMAASLVATIIYYSQSIGLGIAGTAEAYVWNGDLLKGYRAALYSGVGLSGLGLLVALGYSIVSSFSFTTLRKPFRVRSLV
jgi:MFS family permease